MQGEIVDLYLNQSKVLIVVISSTIHIASILCSVVGTLFFMNGGWLLTGPGIAAFNLLPLIMLIFLGRVRRKMKQLQGVVQTPGTEMKTILDQQTQLSINYLTNNTTNTTSQTNQNRDTTTSHLPNNTMSKQQAFAFYMPDVATFFNNLIFSLMLYSLPARMVKFTGHTLDSAVLFTNLLNLSSLISALVLGILSERRCNVVMVMVTGTALFYLGSVLTFGSTTEFLNLFPFQFEIGSLLVGIGDAAVINLCIMSKFVLCEKWGVDTRGNLGARSTAVFNFMLNLSAAAGVALSGLTLSRESEVASLVCTAFVCVVSISALMVTVVVDGRNRVVPAPHSM